MSGLLRTVQAVGSTVLMGPLGCRYVPLGLAAWFKGVGVKNVHELSWWQELRHPNSSVTLACTPAQVSQTFLLILVDLAHADCKLGRG